MRRTLSILGLWLTAASLTAQEARLLPPRDLGRWDVPPGNYSGITPLGDGRYAVVDDKMRGEGFFVWHIRQNPETGQVEQVTSEGFRGSATANSPDAEGVAFRSADTTIWVSREADQRIVAYRMNGQPAGMELAVPPTLQREAIRPNYGFEALAYDSGRRHFWTLTENALPADGGPAEPGDERTAVLRLQAFCDDGKPGMQCLYPLDRPRTRKRGRQYAFGVTGVWVQADGSLLLLEREVDATQRPLHSRTYIHIYKINPQTEDTLYKSPLVDFRTRLRLRRHPRFGNYEGLCEGTPLADGRRTLLLVSDSQGGYGNRLCHLQDLIRVVVLPKPNQK